MLDLKGDPTCYLLNGAFVFVSVSNDLSVNMSDMTREVELRICIDHCSKQPKLCHNLLLNG